MTDSHVSEHNPTPTQTVVIGLLIDTSGSMDQLDTNELAQGATKMVRNQCSENTNVIVHMARFSDEFNIVSDGIDGNTFTLTKNDIFPEGTTCLVPAFARMIHFMSKRIKAMPSPPYKTMLVLLSDGQQTQDRFMDSNEIDIPYEGAKGYIMLKRLIQRFKTKHNWEFFFLGTNYDAIAEGAKFGIGQASCLNYHYSKDGAQQAMRNCGQAMNRAVTDGDFKGFTQNERHTSMNPNQDNHCSNTT